MKLFGDTLMPQTVQPEPVERNVLETVGDWASQFGALTSSAYKVQVMKDNFGNSVNAEMEAYDQRIKAVRDATGATLENPMYNVNDDQLSDRKDNFELQLQELQRLHPEMSDQIRAHVPVRQDALAITRGAVDDLGQAEANAKDVAPGDQWFAETFGQLGGMTRDPVQVAGVFFGGPELTSAKTVGGRILSRVLTDGAINGGLELATQTGAEKWRKEAGLPHGQVWQQVGLAAAFGGGIGGLIHGGGEILKLRGAKPEVQAAMERVANGEPKADDLQFVADAMNVPLQDGDKEFLQQAIENDANDLAVVHDAAEPAQVAQAMHAIENGGELPAPRPEILPPGNFKFFRPRDLKVDAKTFQFKEGGDASGVTDRLRSVSEWKPERSGTLVVFEDGQGQNFVADGHQRTGLANRLEQNTGQEIELPGYVFRAADGYTPEDVRLIAALKNIGEGSGTAIDAAKVLRSGVGDLKSTGLPASSALVRDAAGLSRLSDDAFAMAVNEVVDPKLAAVVGRIAPDKALHAQMIDVLNKADVKGIGEAESMVRDMMAEPTITEHQNSLFGDADIARMLLKEKAQVRGAALRSLRKDKAVFNRLVEEQNRIAEAGNVLDINANTERAKQDAIIIEAIDRLSRQVGPAAQALNDAARNVASGASPVAASRGFIDAIRGEISKVRGNLGRIGEEGPAPALIDDALRGSQRMEPATTESAETAAQALTDAGHVSQAELEAAGQGSMFDFPANPDLMDALPAGTDAEGKPVLTTHAEMTHEAERVDMLADLVAICKS